MKLLRLFYTPGDRIYAYCVNCKRVTSHDVVNDSGAAVCAEH